LYHHHHRHYHHHHHHQCLIPVAFSSRHMLLVCIS
jgi:hypothetical protein